MTHRKIISVSMAVLFAFSALIISNDEIEIARNANGAIINVPGNYSTIQAAINAASPGDVINLTSSAYYQGSIVVNRSVTINGNGAMLTKPSSTVIDIRADNVTLRDLSIYYPAGGLSSFGIMVSRADNCTIDDVFIDDCWVSIGILDSNNTIVNNSRIQDHDEHYGYGISIQNSGNLTISENIFYDLSYGILDITGTVDNSTFTENSFSNCIYGINASMVSCSIEENSYTNSTYHDSRGISISGYGNLFSNNSLNFAGSLAYGGNTYGMILNGPSLSYGNNVSGFYLNIHLGGDRIVSINDTTTFGGTGINVWGDDITIRNPFIVNNSWGLSSSSNNITVIGANISGNEEYGARFSHGSNITVQNCTFHQDGSYDLGISSYEARIFNNRMNLGIMMYGYSENRWTTHLIPPNNTVNGRPVRYFRNQVGGPSISNFGQVILANCSHINITGTIVNDTYSAVQGGFSDNISIRGNQLKGNERDISMFRCEYVELVDNEFNTSEYSPGDDPDEHFGAYMMYTDHVRISNNSFQALDYGAYLLSVDDVIVGNNTFRSNEYDVHSGYSERITVSDNTFESSDSGVRVMSVGEGDISRNTGLELSLVHTSNITVYHNVDMISGYDDTSDNEWNLPYPLGGNHWYDYRGKDFLKGPGQDLLGGDGIGDDPVEISGGAGVYDNYPLMAPVGTQEPDGTLLIISPSDGDVVSDMVLVKAAVSAQSFINVNFFVNGVLNATDGDYPYQFILDTRQLAEDSIVNVTAELVFATIERQYSTVFLMVSNVVDRLDVLGVDVKGDEHHPDQNLIANISLSGSYQQFDMITFKAVLNGPDGLNFRYEDLTFDPTEGYALTYLISSNAPSGSYDLVIDGEAFVNGSMIWTSSGSVSFEISGKNIHGWLDDISTDILQFDPSSINVSLSMIYDRLSELQLDVDFMNSTFSQSFSDVLTRLSIMESGLLGRMGTVENNITAKMEGMNRTLRQMMATSISQLLGRLDDVELIVTGIDTAVADLDADLLSSRSDILRSLDAHDMSMTGNLTDLMSLRFDQLGTLIRLMNASIHVSMVAIVTEIDDFRWSALSSLDGISTYLIGMNGTIDADIYGILSSIADTRALLMDLNNESVEEVGSLIQTIIERIDELDLNQAETMRDDLADILQAYSELNETIGTHGDDIISALEVLDKLDEIIYDVETVDVSVRSSEEDLTGRNEGLRTLLLITLVFLVVIMVLQAFILYRMRKRDGESGDGSIDRKKSGGESDVHATKTGSGSSVKRRSPPISKPKKKAVAELENWDEIEELEEF